MIIDLIVSIWMGEHWTYNTYSTKLQSEDLLYTIKQNDTMFIKRLGELRVNKVKLNDLCVSIHCTYMGGYKDGEISFAETPWA